MEDIENLRRMIANAYDVMMEEDSLTGFIAEIGPYYVQFAKPNAVAHLGQDGTIMVEAVHNVNLRDDEHKIDLDQEAALISLGFELAKDDMGPINWRKWSNIETSREFIDTTVTVFDRIYFVVPGYLKISFV